MASDHVNTCLYPRRDSDTACGYAHTAPCLHCGTTVDNHPSYCPSLDDNDEQDCAGVECDCWFCQEPDDIDAEADDDDE